MATIPPSELKVLAKRPEHSRAYVNTGGKLVVKKRPGGAGNAESSIPPMRKLRD